MTPVRGRAAPIRAPRPDGWEARLAAELSGAEARPWAWGSHDCATFAWRCAGAMLGGRTLWDDLLGRHTTAIGAMRVLRAAGVDRLDAAVDLRAPRIPPAMAQRGDLVCVEVSDAGEPQAGGAPALGICLGRDLVIAAMPGTRRLPMSLATAAWPVDPVESADPFSPDAARGPVDPLDPQAV